MTIEAPGYDVRGTLAVQDEQATGWCWSRQRPGEALRVEVLSDGAVVAWGLAARLVLELVRPGVTDGYHGYLLILPKGLPQTAILEAREARTGQVFARRLPKTLPDVVAWQGRVATLGRAVTQLHDGLGEARTGEARWSAAWGAGGALLDRRGATGRGVRVAPGLASGLALRPVADPVWTVILDLPRGGQLDEAAAQREVMQLAPLLARARADLVVIDDGGAAGFLAGVAGLRPACVPRGVGDVERLTVGLGMARGVHVAMFAPVGVAAAPGPGSGTLRGRAALLAEPSDRVVVGGGAAAAIRGAGLDEMALVVERAGAETGLLLMAPRAVFETVGGLDPAMDDGADLALLDFALRARAVGIAISVLPGRLQSQTEDTVSISSRLAFLEKWRSVDVKLRPIDAFVSPDLSVQFHFQ
jgi:hypothetical protein